MLNMVEAVAKARTTKPLFNGSPGEIKILSPAYISKVRLSVPAVPPNSNVNRLGVVAVL